MQLTGLLLIALLYCSNAKAQEAPYGPKVKITPADFQLVFSPDDTAAGAVVLSDIGSTDIEGNEKGNFSFVFHRFCRIYIISNRGFEAATVSVPVYFDKESAEKVKNISAITRNLEDGRIAETKLDTKRNVFTEDIDKNHELQKFTLPAVKAGSIIEFSYDLVSEHIFNLQPWTFQGIYPCRWSDYKLMVPSFYGFVSSTTGAQRYFINSQKEAGKNFLVSRNLENHMVSDRTESFTITANVTYFRWVMKDVPALREEPFTSCLCNHFSKISFQLAELREPFTPQKVLATWPQAAQSLLKHESFGAVLDADNSWLTEKVKKLFSAQDDELARTRKIFEHVRDQFTCTDRRGLFLNKGLSSVYKNKTGTVAELNFLLIAMLRSVGLSAEPVIMSLRHRGYTNQRYPLIDQYNYVICRSIVRDKAVYLDAAVRSNDFNKLPVDCYNGHARVINETADELQFLSDSLSENQKTEVIGVNEPGQKIGFTLKLHPGYYESIDWKERKSKGGVALVAAEFAKKMDPSFVISAVTMDSSAAATPNGMIKADLGWKVPDENVIYFDPMLGQGLKKNPFSATQRLYPVEMEYKTDRIFQLSMEIPSGYVVDELPSGQRIKLNEKSDAEYEYRIESSGGYITIRSHLQINRTNFAPEEYEVLREFYGQVIKKEAEQIVLKKK